MIYRTVKDSLPYLFHSFRNKYFNKISLANMLYFQNNLYKYKKMHGYLINMQWKIIFRIKCKLPVSSWPVRISILTTCVMWSCTFLIRARDCDVSINYFCPMRQFRSLRMCCMKYFTKSFLCYQQGNKSLMKKMHTLTNPWYDLASQYQIMLLVTSPNHNSPGPAIRETSPLPVQESKLNPKKWGNLPGSSYL